MVVDSAAAMQFLRTAFEPDDWIAVFLKSYETGRAVQRVGPVKVFLEPRVHAWLRAMNARRYNCYVGTNSIRPGVRARTKDSIGTVRHVFLETDGDGQQLLDAIAARRDLPAPSYTIESSPNRFHVLWRVAGFTTEYVERLQKHLARELGTDPAATPCSQTTRIPGYRNQKRMPTHLVTVQYRSTEARQTPTAFPTPLGPPAHPPKPTSIAYATALDVLERARRYAACVEPAITGQHGDLHTFRVCCRIVRGFALSDDEAFTVLSEWNERCEPPWTERELRDKIARARRYGKEEIGGLCGVR
jgi:RepB DNA-primase N-terminal domain